MANQENNVADRFLMGVIHELNSEIYINIAIELLQHNAPWPVKDWSGCIMQQNTSYNKTKRLYFVFNKKNII